MKNLIVLFTGLALLAGCSGGGGGSDGGSDGGFYAGIWDFVGTKALDDCNTGQSASATTRLTVNQDGDAVVVDSGTITLTGVTNSEDGFTATATGVSSSGCPTNYAYVFKDASDGNADARVGVSVTCGGITCTAAYTGLAVRTSGRDLRIDAEETDVEAIAEAMAAVAE